MDQLTIQQAFDQAVRHHQGDQLAEAERLYRQIIAGQPNHAQAIHHLGLIAAQVGRNDIAEDLIRRAIPLDPTCHQMYSNLGNVLRSNSKLQEAIAACRQAIALNPNYAEAYSNLGNALKDDGQLNAAIASYRQAIAINPKYPEALSNLGNALMDKGQADESIAVCRQAIALRPNYAAAYYNLGNALKEKGQLDEAMAAFSQAMAYRPDFQEAQNNYGSGLKDKGKLDEAAEAFRHVIALNPNWAEAHINFGNVLKDIGQLDEAIAAYRRAIALDPNSAEAHSDLVFALQFHPASSGSAIAEEHRRWNLQHAQRFASSISRHANEPDSGRRLRIGYISPDFRNHVVARNLLPLFGHHDHRQFEIICYAHVPSPDEFTRQFQQFADGWTDIFGLSDEQVAGQIRNDRIDILVDLALHSSCNRLLIFARKPAPVQVTFAGYPASTGLTTIDYRLSDSYLDPPGMDESIYSEQTVRLPDSFWCYDPGDVADIQVNNLPAMERGFITFGCLNNFGKVNEFIVALWAKVMLQIENSRLLQLAAEGSHRQRTLERFGQLGIDPGRIEFIAHQSRRDYLKVYHRIDLGLDSFPYNGHTTSLDSFWMGVPVVTLVGQTAVSRAGWSQLSNLGLTELAGQTPEEFVQIAVGLARDLPRLGALRSGLRQRMEQSPLMDAPKFTRGIEEAYRRMWQSWCARH